MASFINQNLTGELELGTPPRAELDLPSRWILSRLQRLIANVQYLFDIYQYGEAGGQILAFMWDEFAPFYLEISKQALYHGGEAERDATVRVLVAAQDACLRLLHPFMPFITEEAWRYIPHAGEALIMADWPRADQALIDTEAEAQMSLYLELVREIRNARGEYKLNPGKRITALAKQDAATLALAENASVLSRLCNVSDLSLLPADAPDPANCAGIVVGELSIFLPLDDLLDLAAECQRLRDERGKLQAQLERTQKMLGNKNFVARARPAVVQRERDRLREQQAALARLDERLASLCA